MRRKIYGLIGLLLACTLCLLVGCTGGGGQSTDTDTETDAPATDSDSVADTDTGNNTDTDSETMTDDDTDTETETETETPRETSDYFIKNQIDIVEPDTTKVPDMAVTGEGYDIYVQTEGRGSYRYGCTYLYNDDGSIDAYLASAGDASEWDRISYRHSPDGGKTWTNEKIILTPTKNSMDHYSNCDPGVVYFDGYYYLGYTSTLNSTGVCNNLFVARSKYADGPFEKWNGHGWGGPDCQPIVYYDETYVKWGIGEPSFVELNGTLYLYYTCTTSSGEYTMVATADATDENWPNTLQFHGAACKKTSDSLDVKYVEEWGKFVAVATDDRITANSWLAVYESNDGMTFTLIDCVKENTYQYLHNAGLSSRRNGHIRITEDADKLCVVYGYGEGWGTWNTRVQPISLSLSSGNDIEAEKAKSNLPDPKNRAEQLPVWKRYMSMIRTDKDVYTYTLSKKSFTLTVTGYDTYFEGKQLNKYLTKSTYYDYDPNVITIEEGKVTIVGVGETSVTIEYEGVKSSFWVKITDDGETTGREKNEFVPVHENYTIYYGERGIYHPQIRGRILWKNGTFIELYVDQKNVDQQTTYRLTYTGYDESIISVDDLGVITVHKVGETDVTVTWGGLTSTSDPLSFTVHVTVSDDPQTGYFYKDGRDFPQVTDYVSLDFTDSNTIAALTGLNSTECELVDGGVKLTVTGGDPHVNVDYFNSANTIKTSEYSAMEITYMIPTDVSDTAKTSIMQCFISCGTTDASEANSIRVDLVADGAYHTIRLELAGSSMWHGNFSVLRLDYFDHAQAGDVMYLRSINLVK